MRHNKSFSVCRHKKVVGRGAAGHVVSQTAACLPYSTITVRHQQYFATKIVQFILKTFKLSHWKYLCALKKKKTVND